MKDQLAFRGKSRSEIVEPPFALASRGSNGAASGGAAPGDASPCGAATRPGPSRLRRTGSAGPPRVQRTSSASRGCGGRAARGPRVYSGRATRRAPLPSPPAADGRRVPPQRVRRTGGAAPWRRASRWSRGEGWSGGV